MGVCMSSGIPFVVSCWFVPRCSTAWHCPTFEHQHSCYCQHLAVKHLFFFCPNMHVSHIVVTSRCFESVITVWQLGAWLGWLAALMVRGHNRDTPLTSFTISKDQLGNSLHCPPVHSEPPPHVPALLAPRISSQFPETYPPSPNRRLSGMEQGTGDPILKKEDNFHLLF